MLANIGTARANQINKITSENWNDTGNNNEKQMADNWFPKCIKHCLDEASMCYLVNDICYTEEDKTHKEFDVRVMSLPASNIAWSGQKARKSHRGKGWKNWPSDVDRMKWINVLAVHLFFFLNWNFVPNICIRWVIYFLVVYSLTNI